MTRLSDFQQKRGTFQTVDFGVPADQRKRLKESEKTDKYVDFSGKLKSYGT